MPSRSYRNLAALPLVLAFVLALPAAASAWTVTVTVHGAGEVDETTEADLMNCSVSAAGRSESSTTNCVAGTTSGAYGNGWIVDLTGKVDVGTTAYNRGWRYLKWVDGTATDQINCDPQETTGNQFSPANCRFQIFGNRWVDLYFDDTFANPVDSLTGSPAAGAKTNATAASFNFNASEDPDSTFQCKLDQPGVAGTYVACGGPSDKGESYSGLTANGSYTFTVRSVDPSGNVGGSMSRSWTVDTVAPTVGVFGGPAQGSTTNSSTASFTLAPSETVSSLQCKLDRPGVAGTFSSCGSTSPSYGGLTADGAYTFSTRATDEAGNTGGTTSRSWTVDRTAPNSSISSGPSGATSSTGASFDFSATGGAVSYECRLSPVGDWESCSSGKSYTSLAPGTYTFSVRATDAIGNVEDTPATRTFTVDTQPPDTAIDSGPSGETTSSSASFTFSATESNVTFQCKLDLGPYEDCSSGKTYSSLATGSHTFYVRARDQAGNVDGSEASRTWTIAATSGSDPSGGTPSGGSPPAGTPLDITAPISLFSMAKQRLGRVLKRGLATSASTSEAGKLTLVVLYKGKRVASASRVMGAAGAAKLVAKFTARWRRKLARLRSAKLAIRLTATDLAGNASVKKKTVTLER